MSFQAALGVFSAVSSVMSMFGSMQESSNQAQMYELQAQQNAFQQQMQADQQAQALNQQAAQQEQAAADERKLAAEQADKIRKAAQSQLSKTKAAYAVSGVSLDSMSVTTVNDQIQSDADSDILATLINGENNAIRNETNASNLTQNARNAMATGGVSAMNTLNAGRQSAANARSAGMYNGVSSFLTGAYKVGAAYDNWKRAQPKAPTAKASYNSLTNSYYSG